DHGRGVIGQSGPAAVGRQLVKVVDHAVGHPVAAEELRARQGVSAGKQRDLLTADAGFDGDRSSLNDSPGLTTTGFCVSSTLRPRALVPTSSTWIGLADLFVTLTTS